WRSRSANSSRRKLSVKGRLAVGAFPAAGRAVNFTAYGPNLIGAVLENCSVTMLRTLLRRTVPTRAFRMRSDSQNPTARVSVQRSVEGLRDDRMKAMNCLALRTVEVTE